MAGRGYRMRKRAEGFDATRERIVEATAALHYEQGVGDTSYVQIAERAGVGPATVYRHFPTLGSLVQACGVAVWEEIRPPQPEDAPALFAGLESRQERLERLVAELDAFHDRAAVWLGDRGPRPGSRSRARRVPAAGRRRPAGACPGGDWRRGIRRPRFGSQRRWPMFPCGGR